MAVKQRRKQTDEEKGMWRALRAGRFAGFKFRRQHRLGPYTLDFYCPQAKFCIELDGFHHGLPEQRAHDRNRSDFLQGEGVTELRFWNHQWNQNRGGVLLQIWATLQTLTGCAKVARMEQNHRFVPPSPEQLVAPLPNPLPAPSSQGEGIHRQDHG